MPLQQRLADQLQAQTQHLHELQQVIASGFYAKWAADTALVEEQTRKLKQQFEQPLASKLADSLDQQKRKLAEVKQLVASGVYSQWSAESAQLAGEMARLAQTPLPVKLTESLKDQQHQINQLKQALASGFYDEWARKNAAVKKEMEALQKQQAWKQQVAEQGLVKASLDRLQQGLKGIAAGLEQIGKAAAVVGAVGVTAMTKFVAVSNPAIFDQFKLSITSLEGVIGQAFAPVLQTVTGAIRELATWFYNLDPAIKAVIVGVAVGAAALVAAIAVVTAGVWALNVALAAADVMSGGILLAIGLVVTALAALVGVAAGAVAMGHDLGDTFGKIKDVFYQVWGGIKQIGSAVWAVLKPFADAFMEVGKKVWDGVGPIFEKLKDIWSSVAAGIRSLQTTAGGFADAFTSAMGTTADAVVAMVQTVVTYLDRLIDNTMRAVVIIRTIWEALASDDKLYNMAHIKRTIEFNLSEYEKEKKRIRDEIDKEGKKNKPAPNFGLQPHLGDLASAKNEFMMASLKASAGAKSPLERIKDLNRRNNDLTLDTNRILRDLLRIWQNNPQGMRT